MLTRRAPGSLRRAFPRNNQLRLLQSFSLASYQMGLRMGVSSSLAPFKRRSAGSRERIPHSFTNMHHEAMAQVEG